MSTEETSLESTTGCACANFNGEDTSGKGQAESASQPSTEKNSEVRCEDVDDELVSSGLVLVNQTVCNGPLLRFLMRSDESNISPVLQGRICHQSGILPESVVFGGDASDITQGGNTWITEVFYGISLLENYTDSTNRPYLVSIYVRRPPTLDDIDTSAYRTESNEEADSDDSSETRPVRKAVSSGVCMMGVGERYRKLRQSTTMLMDVTWNVSRVPSWQSFFGTFGSTGNGWPSVPNTGNFMMYTIDEDVSLREVPQGTRIYRLYFDDDSEMVTLNHTTQSPCWKSSIVHVQTARSYIQDIFEKSRSIILSAYQKVEYNPEQDDITAELTLKHMNAVASICRVLDGPLEGTSMELEKRAMSIEASCFGALVLGILRTADDLETSILCSLGAAYFPHNAAVRRAQPDRPVKWRPWCETESGRKYHDRRKKFGHLQTENDRQQDREARRHSDDRDGHSGDKYGHPEETEENEDEANEHKEETEKNAGEATGDSDDSDGHLDEENGNPDEADENPGVPDGHPDEADENTRKADGHTDEADENASETDGHTYEVNGHTDDANGHQDQAYGHTVGVNRQPSDVRLHASEANEYPNEIDKRLKPEICDHSQENKGEGTAQPEEDPGKPKTVVKVRPKKGVYPNETADKDESGIGYEKLQKMEQVHSNEVVEQSKKKEVNSKEDELYMKEDELYPKLDSDVDGNKAEHREPRKGEDRINMEKVNPNEIKLYPKDIEMHANEDVVHPGVKGDEDGSEEELEVRPYDAEVPRKEAVVHPNRIEIHTKESEVDLNEGEVHRDGAKEHLREVKVHTKEAVVHPKETEVRPNESELQSNAVEVHPNETEVHTYDRKLYPNKPKMHPNDTDMHLYEAKVHLNDSDENADEAEFPPDEERMLLNESEVYLNQTDVLPNESEVYLNQRDVRPNESEVYLNQTDVRPNESEVYLNQTDVCPNEPEEYLNQTDVRPNESEVYLNQRDVRPNESEVYLNQTDVRPNESEVYLNNTDVRPNESEVYLNQTDVRPNESEVYLNQTDVRPNESEVYLNQTDVRPNESEVYLNQRDVCPNEPEEYLNQADVLPNESEVYLNQTDVRPNESEMYLNNTDVHPNESEMYLNNTDVRPNEPEEYLNQTDVLPNESEVYLNQIDVRPNESEEYLNQTEVHPKVEEVPTKETKAHSNAGEVHPIETKVPVNKTKGYLSDTWAHQNKAKSHPVGAEKHSEEAEVHRNRNSKDQNRTPGGSRVSKIKKLFRRDKHRKELLKSSSPCEDHKYVLGYMDSSVSGEETDKDTCLSGEAETGAHQTDSPDKQESTVKEGTGKYGKRRLSWIMRFFHGDGDME